MSFHVYIYHVTLLFNSDVLSCIIHALSISTSYDIAYSRVNAGQCSFILIHAAHTTTVSCNR